MIYLLRDNKKKLPNLLLKRPETEFFNFRFESSLTTITKFIQFLILYNLLYSIL